ncbi:MAG: glycosyltransferase N-terminal domain-containing protein [Bacteroidota bacterium]
MQFLYSFSIQIYYVALLLASPFVPKAKAWIVGRRNWKKQLPTFESSNVVWFHCASLGEFDQGLPLMNLLKEKDPTVFLVVTFFSPSGMEHYHKRQHKVDFAMYLPIDSKSNAKNFIQHFQPTKIFFVKYEFWHFYIQQANVFSIPVYSVSTLLRQQQIYFKSYGGFFRNILKNIDYFFVQNQKTGDLLKSIGILNFEIVGDTRFDRVLENSLQANENTTIEQFLKEEKALIYGSSWPEDEALFIPFVKKSRDQKFIIAPHDISESHIKNIENQLGDKAIRYSQFENTFGGNVLILDTIGHLASAYKYGAIAYVGGGFSGKLHNILEPAVFGLPVIFGPKYSRFPEAALFIEKGIGFSIADAQSFENQVSWIKKNGTALKEKAVQVVNDNKGSSEKIFTFLKRSKFAN